MDALAGRRRRKARRRSAGTPRRPARPGEDRPALEHSGSSRFGTALVLASLLPLESLVPLAPVRQPAPVPEPIERRLLALEAPDVERVLSRERFDEVA